MPPCLLAVEISQKGFDGGLLQALRKALVAVEVGLGTFARAPG